MPLVVYDIPRRTQRHGWLRPITTIRFDDVECRFLLWRLRNVNGVVEALTHHIDPSMQKQQWNRQQVVRRVWDIMHTIQTRQLVLVSGELATAIMVQAIEGNTYFWNLPQGDPRRCAANINKADACRLKIQQALQRPIKRFRI